jgi:GTP-binding protein
LVKPVVAIVGRSNVGKSTLFNRILGSRTAVVDAQAGVTRDRLYRDAEWAGRHFTLVDTGGIESENDEPMASRVSNQARHAIAEADLILFVVDGKTGLLNEDEQVATILRRSGKPVILVVNKIDDFSKPLPLAEFYPLGFGDPVPVSAAEGLNTGDLLDLVVEKLPAAAGEPEPEAVRIAVIGRPNVGKSSLVNALLGEERVIVSDVPGTTRDAIDTRFRRGEREYVFTDTAGIRRKAKIRESIERYSVLRAARALARSDLALIVLDAAAGVTNQDQRIAGLAEEAGKATIIVVNKWDLMDEAVVSIARYREGLREALRFISYAPALFVSAATGRGIKRILDTVDAVMKEYHRQFPTKTLNQVFHDAFAIAPPPAQKGKRLKLFYSTQVATGPPTFLLFVNDPELVSRGYRRYLENQLRRIYGFHGTPIRIAFRRRKTK